MGYRQVVRHRVLIPPFGGSNPSIPGIYQDKRIIKNNRILIFLD